jgi:hypothetical protein
MYLKKRNVEILRNYYNNINKIFKYVIFKQKLI